MLGSVFGKSLWERRRSLAWWIGGAVGYLVLLGSVYPTIRVNAGRIDELLESYPAALRTMFGVSEGLTYSSPEGFLQIQLFSFMIPLVLLIFTVGFGARAIAGEEESGTIDLLLATPVSRRTVVLHKFGSMVALTVAIGAAMFVGLWIAGRLFGLGVEASHLAGAVLGAVLLALVFGGIAFVVGSATGRRATTTGATAGIVVAAYLIFTLADIAEWLDSAQRASPWYYYAAAQPIRSGVDWGHALVLMALIGAWALLSEWFFNRRDLAV